MEFTLPLCQHSCPLIQVSYLTQQINYGCPGFLQLLTTELYPKSGQLARRQSENQEATKQEVSVDLKGSILNATYLKEHINIINWLKSSADQHHRLK
jgi:hypothetical protein